MPGSKFFTFFMPKNDIFFRFLDPPDLRAGGPIFFRHFTKILTPKIIIRFGPPLFRFFPLFLCIFIFLSEKKRGAAGAGKKNDAEAPQAPREKNTYIFLYIFFFDFFFWKITQQNFGNFGNFELFFYTTVSIGKVSFSAKCLFGRIGGLKNF